MSIGRLRCRATDYSLRRMWKEVQRERECVASELERERTRDSGRRGQAREGAHLRNYCAVLKTSVLVFVAVGQDDVCHPQGNHILPSAEQQVEDQNNKSTGLKIDQLKAMTRVDVQLQTSTAEYEREWSRCLRLFLTPVIDLSVSSPSHPPAA